MKKHVPYSIMNYAELVDSNSYFIDKTEYIPALEQVRNPVFLRPKRFGKSLWCSILEHYYDLKYADRFEDLFGSSPRSRKHSARASYSACQEAPLPVSLLRGTDDGV